MPHRAPNADTLLEPPTSMKSIRGPACRDVCLRLARARRRATVRMAVCLATVVSAGCGATDPSANPAGRYTLIGCTYPLLGVNAPQECGWATGSGTMRWQEGSSYLELNSNGTTVRSLQHTFTSAQGSPPSTSSGTSTRSGQWTATTDVVRVAWSDLSGRSTLQRLDAVTVRDNSVYAEWLHFWFVKSP